MLIQVDRTELGDTRLSPEEGLIKIKEENKKLTEKCKIAGQSELEDQFKALGQPMAYQDLIRLLKKLNPAIIVEDGGVQNAVAVRVPAVLEDGTFGKKYVTGFYKEVLPEFSWVSKDSRDVAVREHRGWRTVVIALVKQGFVTYDAAVSMFGEPNGQRSGRWHALLREKK